ncbi:MAG TPA: hypothetical protein VD905_14555 [Flavobacteriales bacterium]|nr:hypothetical protein [Flavobacteriales bacterium]
MVRKNKANYLIALVVLFSCKKSKQDPVDFKYEYAPQTVGHYCVYDVMEITHDNTAGIHDTVTYVLKEKIESTFLDDEGRPSLRLERSKKDSTGSWVISDIWFSTRNTTDYEKVEEDERYVRLAFPVKALKKWDGNVFNQQGEWEYEYHDADVPRTYNGLSFSNTALVLQRDEYNFVQRHLAFEVYAKHVGLVQKYYKVIDINAFDTTLALSGKEVYMTITSYGVE